MRGWQGQLLLMLELRSSLSCAAPWAPMASLSSQVFRKPLLGLC